MESETRPAPFGSRERLVQDMPWLEKCSVIESNAHAAICEGSSGVYEVNYPPPKGGELLGLPSTPSLA